MPLLQRRPSPPPVEQQQQQEESIPNSVCLLETSYDEALGSRQTEVSKLPFAMPWFPLVSSGIVSAPPLLDELNSDSDSSFDDSLASSDFQNILSKIHHTGDERNVEVCVDDGDSFYTAIMEQHSSTSSLQILEKNSKHVSFSSAEYRDYLVIVGDHPGCAAGLPLALSWKFNPETRVVDLSSSDNDATKEEETPKASVQRLTLLQRMKWLKVFHDSSQIWLAERERRKVLEEEEEEMLRQECSAMVRVPTTADGLCGECDCDDDVDPYYQYQYEEDDLEDVELDVIPYEHQQQRERSLLHPRDSCDILQCLDSL